MVAAEPAIRVYLPATVPMLRELAGSATFGTAPLIGHAVTPLVREWYTDGDEEELEYVAFVRAAQQSLQLLHADEAAPRLRVVVSADVPTRLVGTVGDQLGDSEVRVAAPVARSSVAALHCDSTDVRKLVAAAVLAWPAVGADTDADLAVDTVEDEALEWYDVTELDVLIADRSG